MKNLKKDETEKSIDIKDDALKKISREKINTRIVGGVVQPANTLWDKFSVGEVVIVKESYFRVHEITPKRLILRPQKVEDSADDNEK